MIQEMSLDRFRAFRAEKFSFAPLTIIAGQNSSGKSSVIQALNAVLQSDQGRAFPFDLMLNGDRAQLGGIKNVIHGHDARNSFGIGLKFSLGDESFSFLSTFKQSVEEGHLFPRQIEASSKSFGGLSIDWNQRAHNFHFTLNPTADLIARQQKKFMSGLKSVLDEDRRKAVLETLGITDPSQVTETTRLLFEAAAVESKEGITLGADTFSGLLTEIANNPFFEAMKRHYSEAMQQLRMRCGYVGPMRARPSRYFPLVGGDLAADASGEGASRTLAKWKDRKSSLIGEVRSALTQLELASDLTISVEHDEFLKVGIKPHGRVYLDSIADVGYGLSQVLPMIVADLNLPESGTLMVNQPEIHLHPSSQALLANYFVERLANRQYIVETHSEYLINRIRLLVARGEIPSESVCVIYCASDGKGGSSVYDVRIEVDGSLSGAPRDFFATYAADAFGIAMAVMDDDDDAAE